MRLPLCSFIIPILFIVSWIFNSILSDDEQLPPVNSKVLPESNWDDEDVNEDDVKDSWEDDDEPAQVCSSIKQ